VVYNLFPGGTDPIYRELERIYQRAFPSREEGGAATSLQENVARTIRAITDSGLFHEPIVWDHAWIETYTANRYTKLLESFSDHRSHDEGVRETLFHEVRAAIDKHGGTVDRPLQATLFLASAL